jgi:2-polyprenyl-6-hydroxyphenyl methylase/3-demethylubiquinone-9 3-methyltransferase
MEHSSINPQEVKKFTELANEWWKPNGKFKTLHKFNPSRLDFIIRNIKLNYSISDNIKQRPLEGLSILDIGCGGGLMSEPLARLGADVTGIDALEKNCITAKIHAEENNLDINYLNTTAESLNKNKKYDIMLNLEVIEHVNNPKNFIKECSGLVSNNGIMFIATINKSIFSLIFAKFIAEYVLGFLPKGTHDWNKFLTPEDIYSFFIQNNFDVISNTGVNYNPLRDEWFMSKRMDANFIVSGKKN